MPPKARKIADTRTLIAVAFCLITMPAFAFPFGYPPVTFLDQSQMPTRVSDRPVLTEVAEETRVTILEAALSGRFEAVLTTAELNELPPDFGPDVAIGADPLPAWEALDPAFGGRMVLARLAALLRTPPAASRLGDETLYIFPNLTERPLEELSPADEVTLLSLATPAEVAAMRDKGRYTGWRLTISETGVWHSFTPPEVE